MVARPADCVGGRATNDAGSRGIMVYRDTTRSLVARVVTTFTPTGGTASRVTKKVILPHTGRSARIPVTG